MKIGNITTTNSKGQLVIPAAIRAQLGITSTVPLQLLVKGNALYIVPIQGLITSEETEQSYLDILKKTKGSWRKEKSVSAEKREIELAASKQRKQAW